VAVAVTVGSWQVAGGSVYGTVSGCGSIVDTVCGRWQVAVAACIYFSFCLVSKNGCLATATVKKEADVTKQTGCGYRLAAVFALFKGQIVKLSDCQMPSAKVPYCQGAILSRCHIVKLPYCQAAILSMCHIVNVPYCQAAILSSCHIVKLPYCQAAILSSCHVAKCQAAMLPSVKLSNCQAAKCQVSSAKLPSCQVMLPSCHVAKLPSEVAMLPCCHVAMLPSCHVAKLPNCQAAK
jgi:hypothetical protein